MIVASVTLTVEIDLEGDGVARGMEDQGGSVGDLRHSADHPALSAASGIQLSFSRLDTASRCSQRCLWASLFENLKFSWVQSSEAGHSSS